MSGEYNHDDVCRGREDGCDCGPALCSRCGYTAPENELSGSPLLCDECREELATEGLEPCLRCGTLADRRFCSQECEDAERFQEVA